MASLAGKNVVVIGASRGVGRAIVERACAERANVLAVARSPDGLAKLTRDFPGVQTLALDASSEEAPEAVFRALRPDALILSAGAMPPTTPFQHLSWDAFSINWEVDVKASLLFCKAALTRPLHSGATVILISSGAGVSGSPISGGYSGAKRMQMFLARFAQRESERLGLGIRLLPYGRLAPRS